MVRIEKAGGTTEDVYSVARKVRLCDIDLGLDNVLHAKGEVAYGDLLLYVVVHAVDALILVSREVKHRLTHRFAGNCARVNAGATYALAPFDHGHSLSNLRALNRRTEPGGPGTNDNQIVFLHVGLNFGEEP